MIRRDGNRIAVILAVISFYHGKVALYATVGFNSLLLITFELILEGTLISYNELLVLCLKFNGQESYY